MKAISKLFISIAVLSDHIGSIKGTSSEMFQSMDMNTNDHRLLASSTVATGSGIVQPKFTIPPEMKLMSPMQRYISKVKVKDEDGNVVDNGDIDDQIENLNPHMQPCGGALRGRSHLMSDVGSKHTVTWKTIHPDPQGNCTIRLGSKGDDHNMVTLYPLDGSGKKSKGKFPCGRETSSAEGKLIKFPTDVVCDSCTIQLIWDTSVGARQHMCADIELLNGQVLDCGGQCSNGGTCLNGECNCRKSFSGKFCEIVEYIPDKTNYTMYLKYFLFFIIMILIIIALFFGAFILHKNADKIKERIAAARPAPAEVVEPAPRELSPAQDYDPDSLAGPGLGVDNGQRSRFGQNADLFADGDPNQR